MVRRDWYGVLLEEQSITSRSFRGLVSRSSYFYTTIELKNAFYESS